MQRITIKEAPTELSEHKRIITEAYQRGYRAGALVGGFTVLVVGVLLLIAIF